MTTIFTLPINSVLADERLQPRDGGLDQKTVADYALAYRNNDRCPAGVPRRWRSTG